MGNSTTQNCQRGIIFLTFVHFTFFCVVTIVNFCKNRIDPVDEDDQGQAEKYKDGQDKDKDKQRQKEREKAKAAKRQRLGKEEESQVQFDQNIIDMKDQTIQEDDPVPIKLTKKSQQYELQYFPLLMVFILNIVTGTSKAFCFVNFFFTLIVVLVFNVLKAHRQCCNTKVGNVILQNIYLGMVFFGFINHWAAFTIGMPYRVI